MFRLLLFLFLPVAVFAQEVKPTAGASLARLGWLAGNWRMEKGGRVTDEQWMAPAGGVMLGMARTVAKGKVLEFEFTQIREGPGGELFYVAQPARQKEAAFKLVAQTDTDVVFENKEHDFPQTIVYSLRPDGTLQAYVEGPRADGTTRRIEYGYRRVQP
jgi:hypothetical protein